MNPSTNRQVSMKANCDGKEQIFSNFVLNLGNKTTFSDFTTHLSRQTKTAPDSPDYDFTQIRMKAGGKYVDITEENFLEIREIILQSTDKLIFRVSVFPSYLLQSCLVSLLQALGHGKESQFISKRERTSIEPTHSDENHPTNRNPGTSVVSPFPSTHIPSLVSGSSSSRHPTEACCL
jgi:hypothetical protein